MSALVEQWICNPWILAVLLIAGLAALVYGADGLVDGASGLAKKLGMSDLLIGLTVVAFGTSMPEFVVNMVSVSAGSTDLAITNVLGSNIINTFVILGFTAIVWPITSQKRRRDFTLPLSIIAGILVFVMVSVNPERLGESGRGITRLGGIILLLFFCYFLYNSFRHANDHPDEQEPAKVCEMSLPKAIVLILLGLAGLVIGGELVVKCAVKCAIDLGVSEAVIGLTVVALGTSLPELATSVVAAFKKNCDIALGNVIGSNVFNVFFVLGTSAVVRPLPAYDGIDIDAWMAALGSILVWLFIKTNRERQIKRWGGAVLLLVYAAYMFMRLSQV